MTAAESFVDILRARAAADPDGEACGFLDDGGVVHPVSYAELDRQARRIAGTLRRDHPAGARALLLYPPGLDYVAAFFGCLYAGVIAVPAYPPLTARQTPRLAAIGADAEPAAILTGSAFLEPGRALLDPVLRPASPDLAWLATDALTGEPAGDWRPPATGPAGIAFLQYTSGSTGRPKGVMVSHGNLMHNSALIHDRFGHSAASRGVIWLPPYHDMGLIGGILQPVYGGFPVTLMSPMTFLREPLRWLAAISRFGATTSGGPNFAYDLCVRKTTPRQRAELDLSSWSVAFTGAEPVRAATLERFAAAFAPSGFRPAAFFPCYGLAEATLMVTGTRHDAPVVVGEFAADGLAAGTARPARAGAPARRLVSCGQPAADQRLAIVDPATGAACPAGRVGEIWVSGPSVAAGYWTDPQDGGRTFVAAAQGGADGPVADPGQHWLRTGDLGVRQHGELYVTGRIKDLIVIRGRNHAPEDIELTVEGSHPRLRPGCGAALAIDVDGDEALAIVHEIRPDPDRPDPPVDEIAAAVRAAVTREHGLQVHTVALLAPGLLPKTSSGKIQRLECRRALAAGTLPVLAASTPAGPDAAAPGELVAALTRAAGRVLAVAPAELDGHRPLATWGLDSLKAVELSAEFERETGLRLPLAELLAGSGIAELAELAGPAPAAPGHLSGGADGGAPAVADPAETGPVGQPAGGPDGRPLAVAAAPGDPSGGPDGGQLTEGERAMWFLHRLDPTSHAYHICQAVDVAGALDAAALRRAVDALVARHPALRTRFAVQAGAPRRVVGAASVRWESVDATGWGGGRLRADIAALGAEPFDLSAGPLWRFRHYRTAPDRHVVALAVHHIVADLWSLTRLARELLDAYLDPASVAGLPPDPGLGPVYRAEQAYLASPAGTSAVEQWRHRLADPPAALDLPTDRPRPPVQTHRGARHLLEIDPADAAAVRELADTAGVSVYTVLLASYLWLLHRYTGAEDIIVGAPAPGRLAPVTQDAVGLLVNPVPVRCLVSAGNTFADAVRHAGERVREALAAQQVPFPRLVELVQPVRDPARSPLFQTLFVLQQAPRSDELASFVLGAGALRAGELTLTPRPPAATGAQVDLTVEVVADGPGLRAGLLYNADLWDADTIARLAGHWASLLRQAVRGPGRRLADLPLLSEAERHRLLVDWNAERRPVFPELLHAGVLRWAAAAPDATALGDRDATVTYRDLAAHAAAVGRRLAAAGAGPETRVGLLLDRSAAFVAGALGILSAGAGYVPLDPELPPARLAYLIEDAGIGLVVTAPARYGELLRGLAAGAVRPRVIDVAAGGEQVALDVPAARVRPGNLAYLMYTSGSTGHPKGVCTLHTAVTNLLDDLADRQRLSPTDVCSWWTSGGFDVSVYEIFSALRAGAALLVVPAEIRPHPDRFAGWLAGHRVTSAYVPPFALAALADRAETDAAGVAPGRPALALRRLVVSVEPIPEPLLHRLLRALPGLEIINGYGPTETTIFSTLHEVDPTSANPGLTPIGRAARNQPVAVLDAGLRPVPVGVPGELFIGGAGLARGYHGRPAATAERFLPDPFATSPGARMYRTGDITRYRPDGRLQFLGRRDHQLKLRGVRIELGEVEAVLARHPVVASALATVREVNGQQVLVGYVVTQPVTQPAGQPANGAAALRAELLGHARRHLPAAMVPSAVVPLAAWPVTVNGKLDRRALPDPEIAAAAGYEPPATARERAVAAVWSQLLGGRRIGRADDFFALGGHSLLAARAALQLSEQAGLEVPVVLLFTHPTVMQLTAALDELVELADLTRSGAAAITALPRSDTDLAELAARIDALPPDVVAGLLGPGQPGEVR
jgi:amino acid adenylation domain-containing protein